MQAGEDRLVRTLPSSRLERGFTFVAVLAAMFMLSMATHGAMTYVSQQTQREREEDLLRIGLTYVNAIESYYEASPGGIKRWPQSLEDLLEDHRQVVIRRHIREIYPDPFTRVPDWILILAPDGGVMGIKSSRESKPIRTGRVDMGRITLSPATRYKDWEFISKPLLPGELPAASSSPPI